MSDLITWLRAQLDADEASDWPHRRTCQMLRPVPRGFPFGTFTCNCDAASRWIADMEAKRRILDLWEDADEDGRVITAQAIDRVVRLLALPYADQSGYLEEWRP